MARKFSETGAVGPSWMLITMVLLLSFDRIKLSENSRRLFEAVLTVQLIEADTAKYRDCLMIGTLCAALSTSVA